MVKEKSKKQKGRQKTTKRIGSLGYPVGDFLIRVKNAALAYNKEIEVDKTKYIEAVAKVLKEEGFVDEVKVSGEKLKVRLAYQKKEPVMLGLKLISKPGLRIYSDVKAIENRKGPSVLIISTPRGVVSTRRALKLRVGGEVIAKIW
ncbi:30S ribosomal protein S8 [Patescibacteria group bacterium]|nr:30S ribosomal protein S8 [Patescibacteria group bacterium]